MPAGGFKGHVATDGSLLGKAGKSKASGWAVEQLDSDEEMVPLHGEAEFEVQRTVKRAELTAFSCLLNRVIGPIKVYVDIKGSIDGLRRGERECIKPTAGDADLWIKILGRTALFGGTGILVEVQHVKKHITRRKKRKKCRIFEKFITEGNEKADELAKEGALLDTGFMAEARPEAMQWEREEVYAALQCAASFHCLVEEWTDREMS